MRYHQASQQHPHGLFFSICISAMILYHNQFCYCFFKRLIIRDTNLSLVGSARAAHSRLYSPDPPRPGDIPPAAGAALVSPCHGRALPVQSHLWQTELSCPSPSLLSIRHRGVIDDPGSQRVEQMTQQVERVQGKTKQKNPRSQTQKPTSSWRR